MSIHNGYVQKKKSLESKLDFNFFLQRRSLRERHKTTNYKDDFDYNISDEDEEKKKSENKETEENNEATPAVPAVAEPVISGGINQLVAYRPNLEAEGEIALIEKILAMRTVQSEEVNSKLFICGYFL